MTKLSRLILFSLSLLIFGTGVALATPSTTYWTPATTAIQGFGVWHLGVDNYFTVFRDADPDFTESAGAFPTDVGITVGVLPYQKIQMEVGVDLLEPSPFGEEDEGEFGKDVPLYFNFKFGTPEGSLFGGSPAINVGMFNIGTESDSDTCGLGCATNYNIAHVMLGKAIGSLSNIYVGGYSGNKDLLINDDGEEENTGFMVGFDLWLVKDKFQFAADYASGENAFGGGGFGIYWYFAPNASLLTGPVWFNQDSFNGPWKWTTQLDINF